MATITLGTLRDYWKGVYDAIGTFGSAIVLKGIMIAGSDGTNARALKTDTSGNLVAVGTAAHDAAASGNPVQAGGVYRVADPAVTDGDIASLRVNAKGELITQVAAGSTIIGKVGIDQTTPGTTNGVQVNAELPAGTQIVGKVGIDQTTPGTTNGVQVNAALPAGDNNIGNVDIASAIPAGANIIGNVRIDQTTPGTTNGVQVNAALPVGANVIGKVSIDQATPGTTNAVQSAGMAADDAAVSGNPVLLAGKYNAAPATRHDGDVVTLQTTTTGDLLVNPSGRAADNAAVVGNPVLMGGRYSAAPATRHDGDAVAWEMNSTGAGLVQLTGSNVDNDGKVLLGDKHISLITKQINFAGKTTTQTYDVPHVARWRAATALSTPTTGTEFGAGVGPTGYGSLASPDAVLASVSSSTNLNFSQHVFAFDLLTEMRRVPGARGAMTVAELRTAIKALFGSWYGYGTAPAGDGATVKIYNNTTSAWDAFGTNATSAASAVTVAITDFTNYISSTGLLYLVAYTTNTADGFTASILYTDSVSLSLTQEAFIVNSLADRYVEDQPFLPVTVTAGATTAVSSNIDLSRCEAYAIAIKPSTTHTWSAAGAAVSADNVELVAAADRTALVASASQGLKMSAKTSHIAPKLTIYVTNGDGSDRIYYPRIIRFGVKGARTA